MVFSRDKGVVHNTGLTKRNNKFQDKMKNKIGFLVMLLVILSCQSKNDSNDKSKLSKVERIESILDSIGFIKLPFVANFDTTIQNTYRMIPLQNIDTVFRNDFDGLGDVYLVGFLPDTTNFYGILFIGVAAVGNPGLIIFDKSGQKICSEFLTKENCNIYAGDILLCKEYSRINPDMTLDYEFKSSVILEKTDMTTDTIWTHLKERGQINKNGEIIFEKIDTLVFQK